ncbi:MAG: hypothetical protein AAF449_13755, partial [Myxococcota bacterium]
RPSRRRLPWVLSSSVLLAGILSLSWVGANETPNDYPWLNKHPLSSGLQFYLTDGHGTIQTVVSEENIFVSEVDRGPYGELRRQVGEAVTTGLGGRQTEDSASTTILGARGLRLDFGLFMSPEPAHFLYLDQLNLEAPYASYLYAEGDPINGSDLEGLAPVGIGEQSPHREPELIPPPGIIHSGGTSQIDSRYMESFPGSGVPILKPGASDPLRDGPTLSSDPNPNFYAGRTRDSIRTGPGLSVAEAKMHLDTSRLIRSNPISGALAFFGRSQANIRRFALIGSTLWLPLEIASTRGNQYLGGEPLSPSWIDNPGPTAATIDNLRLNRHIDSSVPFSQSELRQMRDLNNTLDNLWLPPGAR